MKSHGIVAIFVAAFAVLSQAKVHNPAGVDTHAKLVPGAAAKVSPVAKPAGAKSAPLPAPLKAKAAAPEKEKASSKVVAPAVSLRAPTKAELGKSKVASNTKAVKTQASPKAASLMSYAPRISPPLHDGGPMGSGAKHQSDKKFFGPPFPADYPDDKRPIPDKTILNKLKSPDQPYPALQSKADFDRDYVKDENSDQGSWKAQFEYDTLRNKIAKEAADAKRAAGRAGKEGSDVDSAQKRADQAAKDVDGAKKAMDDAVSEDDKAKTAEDFEGVPPSKEKLEELKKAVAQAEANYEKEKKDFEECKKQLEEASKNLEELKALQVETEKKLAAETKLWVEQKSVRLNLHKSKQDAAHSKRVVFDERLKAAQAIKSEVDQTLATKKLKHDIALKKLQKEQADVAKAKHDLERATLTLQKLRGYKPAEATPVRSSASVVSALISLALVAMHVF